MFPASQTVDFDEGTVEDRNSMESFIEMEKEVAVSNTDEDKLRKRTEEIKKAQKTQARC
jgi:hypothetical protein